MSKEGCLPFIHDSELITLSSGDRITVVEGTETSFNVGLETLATETTGTFTFGLTSPIFNISGSFNGALGLAERHSSAGDFNYFWARAWTVGSIVCACAEGHRGIAAHGQGLREPLMKEVRSGVDLWATFPESKRWSVQYQALERTTRELNKTIIHLRLLRYLPEVCSVCSRFDV